MVFFFQQLSLMFGNILDLIKGAFDNLLKFFQLLDIVLPFTNAFNGLLPMFIVSGIATVVGIRVIKLILDLL